MSFAPLIQIMFTAQFGSPTAPLHALEIARICGELWPEFDEYSQVEQAGRMPYSYGHLSGEQDLPDVPTTMPRIQITNEATSRGILFQADRLSYAWQRPTPLNEDVDYPGYEILASEFLIHLSKFQQWLKEHKGFEGTPHVTEVAYTDGLPNKNPDGSPRRLSSIFTFLNPTTTFGAYGYEHSWTEPLLEDGLLAVRVRGPVITLGDIAVSLAGFTATIALHDPSNEAHRAILDRIHGRVTEVFRRVIAQERREAF